MIALLKSIQLIEKTSGKKKKEMLFNDLLLQNEESKRIIEMALNPAFPMYVGEAAEVNQEVKPKKEVTKKDFIDLMVQLNNGMRGTQANSAISQLIKSLPVELQEHALRLFQKNLRMGCEWPTYLRLLGQSSFGVILAKDINKVKNLDKKLKFPAYVQPKLDGYRCIAMKIGGEVKLFTRNGKEYLNFPQIVKSLQEVKDLDNFVLDGEIMSDDFQSLQRTAFSHKKKRTVGDVYYLVFDVIPINEWITQKGTTIYSDRLKLLDRIGLPTNCKKIETFTIKDLDEAYTYHQTFCDQGFEGTMLKMDTPYEWDRTENLLKIKDMRSMDCFIIGFEEGAGNFKGTLGRINVLQENEAECGVGSGFTIDERNEFWKNRNELAGRVVEIQYQELSKDGVMRFPVYKRFRDDKELV